MVKSKGGRPKLHDPDYVRDISQQVLVQYYSRNIPLLQVKLKAYRDFLHPVQLRSRAIAYDKMTRRVLRALDEVPKDKDSDYLGELKLHLLFQQLGIARDAVDSLLRDKGKDKYYNMTRCYDGILPMFLEAKLRVDTNKRLVLTVKFPQHLPVNRKIEITDKYGNTVEHEPLTTGDDEDEAVEEGDDEYL